ncbi:MAG: NADP-dependent oxidoreductase [bacterium]|nr:NADP-dependent oxidoreductase [bacterium]
MTVSREIRLKNRPVGVPTSSDFELASVDLAAPGPGEVQVKNLWMSVDPYMRGRMYDRPSYSPPFELGKAMQGGAIGQIVASHDPDYAVGDIVSSMFGWREAFNLSPKAMAAAGPMGALTKIDTHGLPPQTFLGILGMPGMTAYTGLLRIAALKDGDVVFVSAAAGAVGSIVCQIAKIKGHTVIGSAGGPEKVAFLKSIGVDHVIDYKATPDVVAELAKVAPKGIDVYFENVGGVHLEAAINSARPFARMALCGMISQYNETGTPTGPANIIQAVGKSLRLEGFIVSNHYDLYPAFVKDMAAWIGAGKLKWEETVEEGIEHAPDAFLKLFSGQNLGKMLVKLA